MDEKLAQAWRNAAADLKIEVLAPHLLALQAGQSIMCEAYLPHFGSRNGAFVMSQETARAIVGGVRELPEWISLLVSPSYQKYAKTLFKETLKDWGWHGPPDKRPDWLR